MSEEIFKFISNNEYPDSATKPEKFTIRGRASNYVLQGEFPISIVLKVYF